MVRLHDVIPGRMRLGILLNIVGIVNISIHSNSLSLENFREIIMLVKKMKKRDSLLQEIIEEVIKDRPELLKNKRELSRLITNAIEKSLPECAKLLYDSLKLSSSEMLEEHRLLRQEFEARLHRRWSRALNLLEILIVLSCESGEMFLEQIFDDRTISGNEEVCEVIVRLHARACRVAREVLTLLRSGYADGALARWRTLHELTTTAFFVAKHGKNIAIQYLEYEDIERYYEMLVYQKNCDALGYEPLAEEEIQAIVCRKDELVKKYGEEFIKEYGWTLGVLPKGQRSFKHVEENVDFGHWRSYYKLANHVVHSGPKGSIYTLGNIYDDELLLAGASNYGLATPGQNTGISLVQITTCLLTINPSVQMLIISQVLQLFLEELCNEFVRIEKQIEQEETEIRMSEMIGD